MTKYSYLAAIYLSVAVACLQAQNISYKFNDPFKLPNGHKDIGFFGNDQDGFLELSFDRGSDLVSQKIHPGDYKITGEEKLDVSIFPKNFMNEIFINLKSNNYWFYSMFNSELEKEELYAKKVDLKTNRFSEPFKALESNRLKGTMISTGLYQIQIKDKYDFFPSTDSSKLLVKYVLKEKGEFEKNGIFVFDSNMKPIWGKEVEMPYLNKMMSIYGYHVDNDANVYILIKVTYDDAKQRKKDNLPYYYYEILKLAKNAENFQKVKLDFGNKFIRSIKIVEDKMKNVIVTGYYSNMDNQADKEGIKGGDFLATKKSVDGVFLKKLNKDNGIENLGLGFYEFKIDVITAYEKDPILKDKEYKEDKDDAEIDYLDLDYVKFDDAGNVVIVGEQYHAKYRETTNSQMQTKTRINHYFEDIVAVKIGADNMVKWVVKIPKNQRHFETMYGSMTFQAKKINTFKIADGKGTIGFGDLSYYYNTCNGEEYFYYMDNVKNANLTTGQKPVMHASGLGGYLMIAKIDGEGKLTKIPLFDIKEEDTKVRPTHFYNLNKNKIIGLCKVDDGFKILEIKLP